VARALKLLLALAALAASCEGVPAYAQRVGAAVGTDTAWAAVRVTAPAADPLLTSLWAPPADTSPHVRHATFAYTDFRYSYYDTTSRALLATRYDHVMSGSGDAWRALNPTIRHTTYRLLWSIIQPGQSDGAYDRLVAWYAHHPELRLEDAFLHDSAADSAHRKVVTIWSTRRWLLNPADSGLRVYHLQELAAILASGDAGVFYDEFGRGVMAKAFTSLELDTLAYQRATVEKLAGERAVFPEAEITINTAAYTTPFDSACIVAAGSAHLETTDDPLSASQNHFWTWIDHLLAAGAQSLEFVATRQWIDPLPSTLTAGNDVSPRARERMGAYASYLIIRDSARVVSWNQDNSWRDDPAPHWLRAYDADLGRPLGPRARLTSGQDPLGQSYTVWQRRYERALVLVRTIDGWAAQTYGDSTAVVVPLPAPYRLLRSDGTLAAPSSTIALRVGEGAILIPTR
jgi:hypothetical protein